MKIRVARFVVRQIGSVSGKKTIAGDASRQAHELRHCKEKLPLASQTLTAVFRQNSDQV
jgi:hypothetical protein